MNIPEIKVEVVCLFCGSTLTGPEDKEHMEGDLIKCAQCGEENDYESVVEVAREKGLKQMEQAVERELSKQFKNIFK